MFVVISCLLVTLAQYSQGECSGKCGFPETFYADIGCKPVFKDPKDCCPEKYDCSNLDKQPKDRCTYQGKTYAVGDSIPNDDTYRNCNVGCTCEGPDKFRCAILDCPEWLGYKPNLGCQFKYDVDKCCQVGQLCPPFENHAKCEVDGKTYLEGDKFSPSKVACTSCVCQKGFKGEFVEPFCKKRTCSVQIRHSKDIRNYCAAVFFEDDNCCPYEYICPSEKDTIVPGLKTKGKENSELKCKYGEKLLNIGDTFDQEKTKCECKHPPFVTCVKSYK